MKSQKREFGIVYKDHSSKIISFFQKNGLSEPDSDDLTQEVFFHYYLRIQEGEFIKNIRAWLFKDAFFVMQNHLRQAWNRLVICDEDLVYRVITDMFPKESSLETQIIIKEILFSELGFIERNIFLLIGGYSLSKKEIASIFLIKPHQVRFKYNKTCHIIRDSLIKRGIYQHAELF
jgi:DNA-directed RNA polymerase specialized sigma24 family protein